jgi:fumarate reductase subunit C
MNIDFSSIGFNQIVWAVVIILLLIAVVGAIRFFWKHILKYLVQGCVVILAVIALLALLHYLNVF